MKSRKGVETIVISIHALLAESDRRPGQTAKANKDFYPRSPCGERLTEGSICFDSSELFLSTLSLRRATFKIQGLYGRLSYFYPRSPCGERPKVLPPSFILQLFLSTLSLRRATISRKRVCVSSSIISIHALLAESDVKIHTLSGPFRHFYPRSPCGERPVLAWCSCGGVFDFYPRSPCGERLLL